MIGVDLRRSMIDVLTFEDRWSRCRPSKIEDRCVNPVLITASSTSTKKKVRTVLHHYVKELYCTTDIRAQFTRVRTFEIQHAWHWLQVTQIPCSTERGHTKFNLHRMGSPTINNYNCINPSRVQPTLKVDTLIIDLRRSTPRSLIFIGRHLDHRSSKVDTSILDLHRSTPRPSIFEGRHIDHRSSRSTPRSSKVDISIIDFRRSTHRSPKVDTLISKGRHIDLRKSTSIFEGRHIDFRRSKVETSHRQPNIAPTIRHQILSITALHNFMVVVTHTC